MFGIFQKIHRKMKEKSFLRRKIAKIFACGAQKWFISKAFWFKTGPKSLKSPPKGAKIFGVDFFLFREKQIKKHWFNDFSDPRLKSYFLIFKNGQISDLIGHPRLKSFITVEKSTNVIFQNVLIFPTFWEIFSEKSLKTKENRFTSAKYRKISPAAGKN